MKKDKLYTVTKGNKTPISKGISKNNLFSIGGLKAEAQAYKSANPWDFVDDKDLIDQYINTDAYWDTKGGLFNMTRRNNPFSRGNLQPGGMGASLLGAAGTAVNQGALKLIGGDYETGGVGEGIAGVGNTVGGIVGKFNPVAGAIVQGATGVIGGGVNRLFGMSTNEENLAKATNTISTGKNFRSAAATNEGLVNAPSFASVGRVYKGGLLRKGDGNRKDAAIHNDINDAIAFVDRSLENNRANIASDNINNQLAVYSAFGGPLDRISDDMGAIEYGFMSDYLTNKKKQVENQNKTPGISPMPFNAFGKGGCLCNKFGEGGIEIKHPGRLTRLKERTGKTEAELWAEGRPEVKKMITFARNARKWSKAMGGQLHKDGVTVPDNVFCGGGNLFALGGDIQTNGADFTSGLSHINEGSTHELNPNEGVQVGVDAEGTPNLVEEGETIYNDYVYSNRIELDDEAKEAFHVGKKKEITYADMSKNLEKEISERPNDPISKAAFEKQMQDLADHQERQKQEMEAEKAQQAFDALTPEEQVDVMNYAQQREHAEEAAMQEQAMAQEAMAQQQMAMQQPMQEVPQEPMPQEQMAVPVEDNVNAYGGKINRFDLGGQAYAKMLNSLGFHTQKEFDDWAKENNIDLSKIWDTDERILSNDILSNLWKDENFKKALKAKNPALAHAFTEKGYNWGVYQPTNNSTATIQSINKGNWKTTNGKGWKGSNDLAFLQAVDGLTDEEIEALSTEELANRMRQTEAYKKTSKWLENSDNALLYMNTLLNDPNTPEVAKQYARKFIKDGRWKDGFNYNYATVFGSNGKGVRETNPGTYWHTALDAVRGNKTGNFVINADGSIEPIVGDVPTDWVPANNYTWSDETDDYTYNYYKKPNSVKDRKDTNNTEEIGWDVKPNYKNENLRYAGILGPIAGLGLMAAGVGKPDKRAFDAVLNAYDGSGLALADYRPLGNYMTYRPMDMWAEQNRMNANARATDRALSNTSSPSRAAGLLANAYNNQVANGQLYRQGLEYNNNLNEKVQTFNRQTDQYNADAYNRVALANADAINRDRQYRAQLAMGIEGQKAAMDQGWYNSLYGNVGGIFKGLSDLGRENAQHNMIAEMAASGLFGRIDPDRVYIGNKYLTKTPNYRAKCGGKLNRKKGGK